MKDQVIYKYDIDGHTTELDLPKGATILRVDAQNDSMKLWVLVEPINEPEKRIIEIFGTGHFMNPGNRVFINTFLVCDGEYVYHAFELKP